MSNIYFTSNKNYLKHSSVSGSGTMLGPNSSTYGGFLYTRNFTVFHNLGYRPMFRVQYEPFGDGIIWNPLTSRLTGEAFSPIDNTTPGPGIIAWADTTILTIQLYYIDASKAAVSYPIYWTIYLDFQL